MKWLLQHAHACAIRPYFSLTFLVPYDLLSLVSIFYHVSTKDFTPNSSVFKLCSTFPPILQSTMATVFWVGLHARHGYNPATVEACWRYNGRCTCTLEALGNISDSLIISTTHMQPNFRHCGYFIIVRGTNFTSSCFHYWVYGYLATSFF